MNSPEDYPENIFKKTKEPKKAVLKDFANIIEKHLFWGPVTLLKRDTGVFL